MKRKSYFFILFFLLVLAGVYGTFHKLLWMKRFRTTEEIHLVKDAPKTGLEKLRMSGSGTVAFYELKWRLNQVAGPVVLVDLTQEEKPYYCGLQDTLFHPTGESIPFLYQVRRLFMTGTTDFKPEYRQSEKELSEEFGFQYYDYEIRRQDVPPPAMVDQFIEFIHQLPKNAWLHIHCDGGKGRTTTFMIMVDILKNGRDLSIEDIVKRHYQLGGVDLFDTAVWVKGTYTKEQLEARKNFVIQFHQYVNDHEGYGKKTWSDWLRLPTPELIKNGI
jgi:hypothetical protein